MIYLYLKTHNKTGLKYLGKTTRDPYIYKGSGVIWKCHLKKYGNDVSTKILFQSTDKNEFKNVAVHYSNLYNIVESTQFANLTIEEGQGGSTWIGRKHSKESKEKITKTYKDKNIKPIGKSRQCSIDGVIYKSTVAASEILGIHHTTIAYRCRSKNCKHYFYT
jgi:mevalonate pyrophosphate decarboxylase